jgi:hypothetical protein
MEKSTKNGEKRWIGVEMLLNNWKFFSDRGVNGET